MILVLSREPTLAGALSSEHFVRSGVPLEVVANGQDGLSAWRSRRPRALLLDATIEVPDPFVLAQQLRQEAPTAVIVMLLPRDASAEMRKRARDLEPDDIVFLPLEPDELFEHAAALLGLPIRRGRRVTVKLRAAVIAGSREASGWLDNLSLQGARVRLDDALPIGTEIVARFGRDGSPTVEARARVVWCQREGTGFSVGLQLLELDRKSRLELDQLCLWDLQERGGRVVVAIQGHLNETIRFDDLAARLSGHTEVDFDLADVQLFNSAAVRPWSQLLEAIAGARVRYLRCSPSFTMQAARVPDVVGHAFVCSFTVPYHCDQCERETTRLLQRQAMQIDEAVSLPSFPCRACKGGRLVLDEMPEEYFRFLLT